MNIQNILTTGLLFMLSLTATAQTEISVYDDNIGQDEAIGLPEGMMSNELDSLLREWNAKNYLTFD